MASSIPTNLAHFTAQELVSITGGELVGSAAEAVSGVTTDTRGDLTGKLFVALKGEHFDGHTFANEALEAGAAMVLVERSAGIARVAGTLLVDDTLRALGAIAAYHRQRWGGRVVAVGGSAGKTTTRSAIYALLRQVLPAQTVWSPPGNLNNRIGVPMVLLALTETHQTAVVEIGTNAVGEVGELARMASPNIAVLTLIDLEHTEGLGDLAGVEEEEGALFHALGSESISVGNADDERVLRQLLASPSRIQLSYGTQENATYRVQERVLIDAWQSQITLRFAAQGTAAQGTAAQGTAAPRLLQFRTALSGRAGALAAACAIAVTETLLGRELARVEVEGALNGDVGESGRLRPVELQDGTLLIDDSYNSNPASVLSSVECAEELAKARKARLILVVGEMRELGALAVEEHARIGLKLAVSGAKFLLAVAGESLRFVPAAKASGLPAEFVESSEAALLLLLQHIAPGDVILVKASRGVRAERISEGLILKIGRAA